MQIEEALRRVEKRLGLLETKEELMHILSDEEQDELVSDTQALRMVLASAQFLHKDLLNTNCRAHLRKQFIVDLNTDYAETKCLSEETARKIGLEVS